MKTWRLAVVFVCFMFGIGVAHADKLRVLAAGSLRDAIGEIGERYHAETGTTISAVFGPSGVLRERIEKGEHADLFASADMGHPLKLLADGRAVRVAMFTRNALCGIALPKVGLTTANFLDRLLDPAVKLATSTPKADPGGDYTWAMFRRADALRPGSYALLDKKADKIVGGPATSASGASGGGSSSGGSSGGGDPVAAGLSSGNIDVMIGYCSGRQRLAAALPTVQFVPPPRAIAGGPEYGLAVLRGAGPRAADFALFMLSPEAQQILARDGFAPVGLPTPAPQ
jgi:molybdate transport system substrate-binding protein